MINIVEIKAKCENQDKVREILESRNAIFKGTDHQVDIYFESSIGRLKLRKGNIENNLIQYLREDKAGPKHATVSLYKTKPDSNLEQVLTNALGVKVVVDKQREIYFIENVKFHLDVVQDLGTFLEIEAIDETGERSNQALDEQCKFYLSLFEVQEKDLVTYSYSDLILGNNT